MPDKYAKLNNVSNEAVQKATGKSWEYWVDFIDNNGGLNMNHQQILRTHYKDVLEQLSMMARGIGL